MGGIGKKIRRLMGRKWKRPAGHALRAYPDDLFIVSYPKSGNTWVRFLVANLIYRNEAVSFANIERLVPDIYKNTKKDLKALPRPRILKSHSCFQPDYRRVLYIVRDPRDVAVSAYYHHLKTGLIDEDLALQNYVSRLIGGELGPFSRLGTWGENVGSWLGARKKSRCFLLLRYENLRRDPLPEVEKIAFFLDIKAEPSVLRRAIEQSSFERMRTSEKVHSERWKTTQGTRKDIPFVRSGKAGGWKDALPETSQREIEEAWGDWMRELGYLKNAPVGTACSGNKP